jgi:hypothetical protein
VDLLGEHAMDAGIREREHVKLIGRDPADGERVERAYDVAARNEGQRHMSEIGQLTAVL